MYYNIYGGRCIDSLEALTGFKGNITLLQNLDLSQQYYFLEKIYDGIKIEKQLFGVGNNTHAFSLLDIKKIPINDLDYHLDLELRNPWGNTFYENIFDDLIEQKKEKFVHEFAYLISNDNGKYILKEKIKGFLEPEIKNLHRVSTYYDNSGIFYISPRYFFDFFITLHQCYTIFDCNVIEYSIKFVRNYINANKKYFYFNMKVKNEVSFIQFNLTTEGRDEYGKIIYDYYDYYSQNYLDNITFIIRNKNNNEVINDDNVIKLIEEGEYIIKWHYENKAPEDEILFWIPYGGDIEIEFLGTTDKNFGHIKKLNEIIIYNQTYNYSKKLGEFNNRETNMKKFLNTYLCLNINPDEEENGNSLDYHEDGSIFSCLKINKNDPNNNQLFTQNLDFPQYIFTGSSYYRRRIIGEGAIYQNVENNFIKVYEGFINYNLFPNFMDDKNCKGPLVDKVKNNICEIIRKSLNSKNRNINFLLHKHKLYDMKNIIDYTICFCCLKNKTTKYYKCMECDFRICSECKITQERGEQWQFLTCWHEHPLTLCKTKGKTGYNNNNNLWNKWKEIIKIKENNIKRIINLEKDKENQKQKFMKENFVYGSAKSFSYSQTKVITEEPKKDIVKNKM